MSLLWLVSVSGGTSGVGADLVKCVLVEARGCGTAGGIVGGAGAGGMMLLTCPYSCANVSICWVKAGVVFVFSKWVCSCTLKLL